MAAVLVDGDIEHSYGVAAIVLVVAGVSDFLDGYLARRWGIASVLGGFLDQIADKLFVAGVLLALVEVGRVWAWAAFLIVAREIAVTGLRGIAALDGGLSVAPSLIAKWKTTIQFAAIGLVLLRTPEPLGPLYIDQWAILAAVAVTVISGVEYFVRFSTSIRALAR